MSLTPDDPRHGKRSTYTDHSCRCDPCRQANADYHRKARDYRYGEMVRGESRPPHGKASTYRNWGCRCARCTRAHGVACREYMQRRRGAA